jgi:hypothetical protein
MDQSTEGEHASCREEPVRLKEGGKIEIWQAKAVKGETYDPRNAGRTCRSGTEMLA